MRRKEFNVSNVKYQLSIINLDRYCRGDLETKIENVWPFLKNKISILKHNTLRFIDTNLNHLFCFIKLLILNQKRASELLRYTICIQFIILTQL